MEERGLPSLNSYMIEADNAAAPKMLTFKGVEDSGSVFKLRLMEK